MTVFVVIPTGPDETVAQSIAVKCPDKFYKLPSGEFLVSFLGTSKSLSDHLGITDGTGGLALVVSISGYFGRAPNDIWEWIKQHWDIDK